MIARDEGEDVDDLSRAPRDLSRDRCHQHERGQRERHRNDTTAVELAHDSHDASQHGQCEGGWSWPEL